MNQLAFDILTKAKDNKETFIDLGCCGLEDNLPDELFDNYFLANLSGLNLGDYYSDEDRNQSFSINEGKSNRFSENELYKLRGFKRLRRFAYNILHDEGYGLESMGFISNLKKLTHVELIGHRISNIEGVPEGLLSLDLSCNRISKIEGLNEKLQLLVLMGNRITRIEGLNKDLKSLFLNGNQITKIEGLNENLFELYLAANDVRKIENLNDKLELLDLAKTGIRKVEGLNERLRLLDVSCNEIENLEEVKSRERKDLVELVMTSRHY